jgi:hypothetical protein
VQTHSQRGAADLFDISQAHKNITVQVDAIEREKAAGVEELRI